MRDVHKTIFIWLAVSGMRLAALAAIVTTSNSFDTGIGGWVHVGTVTGGAIAWDDYSGYDGTAGDGVQFDGGLFLDTANGTKGDEAIGLAIGGTMEAGEEITFTGSVYNDNSSYSRYNAQLWNLTDGTLLAQSGNTFVASQGAPVSFNVAYTAEVTDVSEVLQIRFVEDNDHTARDIFVDNYSVISSVYTGEPPATVSNHPRLFFSTNELADIQARRFTTHADEWAQLIATCNSLQGTTPTTTPRTASGLLAYEDKIVALALAQLVDPTLGYQTTSTNWFWTIMNWTEWGPGYWSWPNYGPRGNLETGEILRALAIWYDLQYHTLTPAEQADASQRLADYADRYRNSYSRFWTTDNGELTGNHCWNAFASLAAVYYASDDVSPARQSNWSILLNGHYNTISNLMTTVMSDGVTGEGGTYWTYGIEKILLWYEMRRVAGDPAFENIDWFANTGTYGIYSILPGGTDNFGGITRFDDANPDYWGNPYNELSLLAKATRDPVAQWMANELDHSGELSKNPYRYMFYDPTVPTIDPETDLNNWRYFDDYGFLLWRTSWADNAQHFSIRSGQHSHGHSKCDDGQFMIHRAGVPYIANLGYAVPRYTQDANVLLIDGTGQYSDGDDWGEVFNLSWPNNTNTWGKTLHVLANETYYQKGDFFNILIDPTQMYTNPDLSSWQREVVGLGGDLYLLRDAVSASSSVVFDLLLHAQVTVSSGDTFNQDTYASSNPWTDLGSGNWEINARSGSPKMKVQDLSEDSWSSAIEESWYYDKYDSTPPTRRGNKLKRSLAGTAGTSLVSFGFDDLMTGWTQSDWTNSNAEGVHVVNAGMPEIDVLWPLNGTSVTSSDGWSVTGKMAGRRYAPVAGNPYYGWMDEYDGTSPNTLALYKFSEAGVYTNGANAYSGVLPDQAGSDWDAYYPYATATSSFGAGGKFGWGLACSGGGGWGGCLTYNGSNVFPAGADPSLSMECWVKFNDTSSRQFLISKGNAWSSTGGYDLWYDNGSLKMAVSGGSAKVVTGSWTPVAGTWYHIAGTWDTGTDTARLHVNDVEIASQVFAGLSIIDHPGRALTVGNRSISTYYALSGVIDEVRISDVAYAYSLPYIDATVCYFGREATFISDEGQVLLSATAPVSFHAKTEQLPGGIVPNRIVIQADAASTVTVYAPYEPKSVLLDNVNLAFVWTNNQLTVAIPATDGSILDLVDADYLAWRDQYFSEAEIGSGLAGLDMDADGDNRSNWDEFIADTDPRDINEYLEVTMANGTVYFYTSSNRLYTLEYETNLLAGASWSPLIENVPGTGSIMPIVHTNDYDNCFYRTNVTLP